MVAEEERLDTVAALDAQTEFERRQQLIFEELKKRPDVLPELTSTLSEAFTIDRDQVTATLSPGAAEKFDKSASACAPRIRNAAMLFTAKKTIANGGRALRERVLDIAGQAVRDPLQLDRFYDEVQTVVDDGINAGFLKDPVIQRSEAIREVTRATSSALLDDNPQAVIDLLDMGKFQGYLDEELTDLRTRAEARIVTLAEAQETARLTTEVETRRDVHQRLTVNELGFGEVEQRITDGSLAPDYGDLLRTALLRSEASGHAPLPEGAAARLGLTPDTDPSTEAGHAVEEGFYQRFLTFGLKRDAAGILTLGEDGRPQVEQSVRANLNEVLAFEADVLAAVNAGILPMETAAPLLDQVVPVMMNLTTDGGTAIAQAIGNRDSGGALPVRFNLATLTDAEIANDTLRPTLSPLPDQRPDRRVERPEASNVHRTGTSPAARP
jgi:hypothetical protein